MAAFPLEGLKGKNTQEICLLLSKMPGCVFVFERFWLMLSELGSNTSFVKALAYHRYSGKRTGCIRASAFPNGTLFVFDSRKLR